MKFRVIKAEDKDIVNKFIGTNITRVCENTFGVMYLWCVHDEYELCIEDDVLYFASFIGNVADFYYPIGEFEPETALKKIHEYCNQNNLCLRFSFLTLKQAKVIKEYFGDKIILAEDRDWEDYIYNYSDLMELNGKKYHGQKNHINRFINDYKDYKFLPYEENMYKDVEEFLNIYYTSQDKDSQWFIDEKYVIQQKLLKQFEKVGQSGGVITVDNKIIAIAFGEIVGDTLYVHFEKALREYSGSYAIINQSFCSYYYREGLKYINREEDTGDFGLRTAKLSLHPIEILAKYFGKVTV